MIFIFIILAGILIIPYVIDIYINGKLFVKRLKIGRWSNREKWEASILFVARKWTTHPPVVKKTDNNRLIVIDVLKKNYKNPNIQSWQSGMTYLAIVEREENVHYWDCFIDKNGNWINDPQEIDFSLLAYAILKDTLNNLKIKPAMDYMYKLVLSRLQEEDGCIAYRTYCKNQRYVDTIGFVTPFLSLYGIKYQCSNALDLSKHIIITYYYKGFDVKTKLPFHAYDSLTQYPLGMCGWGRGVGWFLLGLTDTYLIIQDEELKVIMKELANKYSEYQKKDGSFTSVVQLKENSESSVTSVMSYFYAICAKVFNDNSYKEISQKCINYLMKATRRNGEVDFSQGDTKGIGFYSLTSDVMPFTQGMSLRAVQVLNNLED